MKVCLPIVLLAFSSSLIDGQQLPSHITLCYRDDPLVADCIKREIERLVPLFKSGSKEFDLESLDPLLFTNHQYKFNSRLIGGTVVIPNAAIYGMENIKVRQVHPDFRNPKKFILDFDAFLPRMIIKAFYKLVGNVATLPVSFNGKAEFELGNVNVTYHIEGNIQNDGEHEHLHLNSFTWKMKGEGIEWLRLRNKNLVNGQPVLNGIVIGIVNSSWRQLKNTFLPEVLADADKTFLKMFTKFFLKFPFDILFPKSKK